MTQLCLKWNNHDQALAQCLYEQYENQESVDVTLACQGQQLKAHKAVLSACSPFFQSLLLSNPCKHPIVILKDVRFQDLRSLIDFMYRGEVTVGHDQLPTLLRTAECLQVKQLAEMTQKKEDTNQRVQRALAPSSARASKRARQRIKRRDSGGESGTETVAEPSPSKQTRTTTASTSGQQQTIEYDVEPTAEEEIQEGGTMEPSHILEHAIVETVVDEQPTQQSEVIEEGHQEEQEIPEEELMRFEDIDDTDAILVYRKKQSFVWEYFSETGKNMVKCRQCSKLLSYKDSSGSTSNMIKHLRTVHHISRLKLHE